MKFRSDCTLDGDSIWTGQLLFLLHHSFKHTVDFFPDCKIAHAHGKKKDYKILKIKVNKELWLT